MKLSHLIDDESIGPVEHVEEWRPHRLFRLLGVVAEHLNAAFVLLKNKKINSHSYQVPYYYE